MAVAVCTEVPKPKSTLSRRVHDSAWKSRQERRAPSLHNADQRQETTRQPLEGRAELSCATAPLSPQSTTSHLLRAERHMCTAGQGPRASCASAGGQAQAKPRGVECAAAPRESARCDGISAETLCGRRLWCLPTVLFLSVPPGAPTGTERHNMCAARGQPASQQPVHAVHFFFFYLCVCCIAGAPGSERSAGSHACTSQPADDTTEDQEARPPRSPRATRLARPESRAGVQAGVGA